MTQGKESTGRLVIRQFRLEDSDALTGLNAYGLKAAGIPAEADHYANTDMADLEATYTPANGGQMLVGEVDGTIVAMGGIRRINATTCELLRMRVYPGYQNRGFGTALLKSLEKEAKRLGYRRITLITGENQHPAIDLYLRHGYQVDQRDVLINIPSAHMSKKLVAG